MTVTTIHQVIGIRDFILMVFYAEDCEWQFRVLSCGGVVFGERKLYFSAQAAEKAGREWIGQGN